MKRSILSLVAAAALLSGSALAETTTTTTTWTNEYGTIIRQHSTTERVAPYVDPKFDLKVGVTLPQTVTVHPLPPTVRVTEPERYSYVIVNDRPVVVARDTRRVVHIY